MTLSNPALLFKVLFVIMNGLVIYSPQMSWNILSLGLKFIRQLSRLIEPSYHLEKKKVSTRFGCISCTSLAFLLLS